MFSANAMKTEDFGVTEHSENKHCVPFAIKAIMTSSKRGQIVINGVPFFG